MKKINTLSLCLMVALVGFIAISGIFFAGTVSLSKYANTLKAALEEREELIIRIENSFFLKREFSGKKTITPVVFIPTDVNPVNLSKDLTNVRNASVITQAWVEAELNGLTFSLGQEVVVWGRNTLAYYDSLDPAERIDAIRHETNVPGQIIIFLYGSTDYRDWGVEGTALMSGSSISMLAGDSIGKYKTIVAITHELGHLWGLPHNTDPGTLMFSEAPDNASPADTDTFSLAGFTAKEKKKLRRIME